MTEAPGGPKQIGMHVEYKDMPALRVAAVRHQGPYHQIAEAFGRLGEVAAAAGLQDAPRTMLAVYHDDPAVTPAGELRSEAAIVLGDTAAPPGLVDLTLPAGRYAVTTHVGPYGLLSEAWAQLRQQVTGAGQRPSENAISYEIYRNTPETVPDSKLLTELYLPVAETTEATSGKHAPG